MRILNWVIREMEDQVIRRLRNCTTMSELKRIHAHIVVSSPSQSCFLATQILNVCKSNGRIDYAALVFNQVMEPNVFLYNAMIKAYTQHHHYAEAIGLYTRMMRRTRGQDPIFADRFTYPFVLRACAGCLLLRLGKQVHTHVFKCGLESNSIVQNSLIELYAKCEDLTAAHKVFDEMGERDVVSCNTLVSGYARLGQIRKARTIFNSMVNRTVISWTALISGYTAAGRYSDAIEVFHQMQLEGFEPDDISIVSVLPACAQLGALELGKWIHAYSDKHGLLQKTFVSNALVEMYAKCGSIKQARQVFDEIPVKDVISWSTMIGGLAAHGRAREAIRLFSEMENDTRVRPNGITFLGLLSACCHAGLLDEGLRYFGLMEEVYGIRADIEHYSCMVDLLGRSGCIDHALKLIDRMPFPPDVAIWGSLLTACRTYGDVKTAAVAAQRLVELEPEDTGNYVMLSNIYAAARRWDGVREMRKLIRSNGMQKTPGCSSVEVNNMVQEFIAGDDSNPHFAEIAEILEILSSELGYNRILKAMEAGEFLDSIHSPHELSNEVCFT